MLGPFSLRKMRELRPIFTLSSANPGAHLSRERLL
jgi:hypothetical protein